MSDLSSVFLVLMATVAAGLWLWPRRMRLVGRYRVLRGKSAPRFPILLAHGLFGFDELVIGGRRHVYFRGIAEHLRARGVDVYVARVDPSADIAQRAAQLAEQIRKIPAARVNVVGHSMGGLDARYAIARLGIESKVASLVTIGTPHHGTPLADHGVNWLGDRLGLRALANLLGIEIGAFDNLTTAHLTRFNTEVRNREQVLYASVVGRATDSGATHPAMIVPGKLLSHLSGENDGLVPVSSQAWGKVWLSIDACHLAQIGWLSSFDPKAIFDPIVRELLHAGC